jgi:F-type H+-transporting ATPase subunit gamma
VLSSTDIEKKITGFHAIDDIVGVMKAYAGVAIRKTDELVKNVRTYENNVLHAMADVSAHYPTIKPQSMSDGKRIVVVFGSSQGLCGSYNENIADKAIGLTSTSDTFFVIGKRLREALETRGVSCAVYSDSVGSVNGIERALRTTAVDLWRIYAKEEYYALTFFFMTIERKKPQFTVERILPPDMERVRILRPLRFQPFTYLDPQTVFTKVLEELLYISLYRCYLESLRSENWFRLRSMEGASENLKRRLSDLGSLGKYVRQEEITEEMLEILGSGAFYRKQFPAD